MKDKTPYLSLEKWMRGEAEQTFDKVKTISDCLQYSDDPITFNQKLQIEEFQEKWNIATRSFSRNHTWRLNFGENKIVVVNNILFNVEDVEANIQSLKFTKQPKWYRNGSILLTFTMTPKVIDFLALKPRFKSVRIDVFNKSDVYSYINLNNFKFIDLDFSCIDLDYTKADVNKVNAIFSYSKYKIHGSVVKNGTLAKPLT